MTTKAKKQATKPAVITKTQKTTARKRLKAHVERLEKQVMERRAKEKAEVAELKREISEGKSAFRSRVKKEEKLNAIIAEYEKNEKYANAGKAYTTGLKTTVRRLAIQVGDVENLEEDNFLSRQLSACGPPEEHYLLSLISNLKQRRGKIFKVGSIEQDDDLSDPAGTRKQQYELGTKIGKHPVIPVH